MLTKVKKLDSSNKSRIFAESYEEPTALATDSGKALILQGEDAERFERLARQAEREYEQRKNKPKSLEKLQEELQFATMRYEFKCRQLKEEEKRINNLKNLIQEKLNGKGKGQ